jgi:hypothetical protein
MTCPSLRWVSAASTVVAVEFASERTLPSQNTN